MVSFNKTNIKKYIQNDINYRTTHFHSFIGILCNEVQNALKLIVYT